MIVLVKTCEACPEQYDAYREGNRDEIIAYLRLRHGTFRVECPDVGGTEVYRANPEGDGIFEYEERDKYLTEAVKAIMEYHGIEGEPEYTYG